MEWNDMSMGDKLIVLSWAYSGLKNSLRVKIENTAYRAFCDSVQRGIEFSIERIWSGMPAPARNHWDHIQPYLDILSEEIRRVQQAMTGGGENG